MVVGDQDGRLIPVRADAPSGGLTAGEPGSQLVGAATEESATARAKLKTVGRCFDPPTEGEFGKGACWAEAMFIELQYLGILPDDCCEELMRLARRVSLITSPFRFALYVGAKWALPSKTCRKQ